MYYCSNKDTEYPLLLGAEMLKWSHGPVHPWTRLKGWCLDNDIPAQYWFSTPVTMSGSHNRSCSCSHPGTHHAIINTSLFICSFSVLCVVCSEILADEETHQTALHLRVHSSPWWLHTDPGGTEVWRVALVVVDITTRHSRYDDFELCLDSSLTFTRRTRDIESAQCDVSESRTRRCWGLL